MRGNRDSKWRHDWLLAPIHAPVVCTRLDDAWLTEVPPCMLSHDNLTENNK